jgi:DNA repair exonuclease SbcCD nuclease subunit
MTQEETQTSQTAEEQKTFTQSEVDDIIKKRLSRAKSEVPSDYEELKSKAQKFDELENANKTELQKATEELEKLKGDIAKRDAKDKANALKAKISKDTGVPAELIAGADEDEMKAWAERVAEYAKKDTAPVLANAGKFASATKPDTSSARNIARQIK